VPGKDETNRLEAFSDGVIAIAITLLVLNIHIPTGLPSDRSLTIALLDQWPTYLGFLASFATIGIMWINHHRLFSLIERVDNILLLLNMLLLLGIVFVPFPTGLVTAYIGQPGERTAVLVYTGTFVLIAIFYNLLWIYASRSGRLLNPDIDPEAVKAITRQYRIGPFFYLAAFLIAFVSPTTAVLFTLLLAIYFALPGSLY
jgi:uncharacterized membrane protein